MHRRHPRLEELFGTPFDIVFLLLLIPQREETRRRDSPCTMTKEERNIPVEANQLTTLHLLKLLPVTCYPSSLPVTVTCYLYI
jgi:hypothetical protein